MFARVALLTILALPLGTMTASADGPAITSVLVTQVLGDQADRYVAGKDIVVRVLLSAEAVPDATTQSVVVKKDGASLATLKPAASTSATSTLVFACPTSAACGGWKAGSYTFDVTVGASTKSAAAKVQERGSISILALNIKANYGGEPKQAGDAWKQSADFMRRVFPLAPENLKWNIGADVDLTAEKFDLRTENGPGEVLDYLRQLIPADCKQTPRPAGLTCYDAVVGFVPEILGKDRNIEGLASKPTALVNLGAQDAQATVAHEVAHLWKVSDEYASGKMGTFWCYNNQPPASFIGRNGDTGDDNYSCPDSKEVPFPGVDGILVTAEAEYPYEIAGRGALGDFTTYMGTGALMHQQWTSRAIWRVLFDAFDPAKIALTSAVEAQATPSRFISISGNVDQKGNVELFPGGTFTSTNTHKDSSGAWTARAVDASGRVLATTKLDIFFEQVSLGVLASEAPLDAILPFPTTTAKFEILKGTSVMRTLTPSRTAPTVTLTAPAANESVKDGEYTIRWTGADADGDALQYTVEYSIDGKEWIPIATELTATSFTEDFSYLPGSGKAESRVRVTASDGVHSASVTSGLFTVQAKAPFVDIEFPDAFDEFAAGEEVYLYGGALDTKDDTIGDDGLVWTSSLQGHLGTGELIALSDLRQGEHTITLTATNSLGLKATATRTITIHPAGRKVRLADVYAVYNAYLARDPVFGVETPGWIGMDFAEFVSEVRWSDEALTLADEGYLPATSVFTGLPIKR